MFHSAYWLGHHGLSGAESGSFEWSPWSETYGSGEPHGLMFRIWKASKHGGFHSSSNGDLPIGYTQFASVLTSFLSDVMFSSPITNSYRDRRPTMICPTFLIGKNDAADVSLLRPKKACDFLRKVLIPPMTSLKAIWQSCPFGPTSVQTWQMPDDLSNSHRHAQESLWSNMKMAWQ